MSSLAILAELPDISYHNDWTSVKQALQNWSVRDKFTYKTPCKDDRRARYICTMPGCIFRVTGNRDRSGRITVRVVNRRHTCTRNAISHDTFGNGTIDNPIAAHPLVISNTDDQDISLQENPTPGPDDQRYRNAASQMNWLVTAIGRVLDITTATKPADIQNAAKEFYNEQISYQQAFRCFRLLTVEIKEQGHRDRVPDDLRKAIVALRVFVDPPMDWAEIERKTGVKARTAGYVFACAVKKSGGSEDPLVLLKNATLSVSGPKSRVETRKLDTSDKTTLIDSYGLSEDPTTTWNTPSGVLVDRSAQPQKKRKRDDEVIDPHLDVTIELTRVAAGLEDEDDIEETLIE